MPRQEKISAFNIVDESRKSSALILDLLKRHKIPTAGFVIGQKIAGEGDKFNLIERKAAQDILTDWKRAGVVLGNHTQTHPALSVIGLEPYIKDAEQSREGMAPFIGEPSVANPQFFRFPYLDEGNTADEFDGFKKWLAQNYYIPAPVSISLHD